LPRARYSINKKISLKDFLKVKQLLYLLYIILIYYL
jgi:hypothetical protein